jgi:hypothetical protein
VIGCGGCDGLGAHRKLCVHHPNYHPWRQYAVWAEAIGDGIGGNDPGLANEAYILGTRIKQAIQERPWSE